MRASHLFVGFVTLGVFACGGSNGPHIIIDANVPDSPPDAFVCSQKGTLNGTSALDFGTNTTANPIPGAVPSGGTELTVEAIVTFQDAPTDGFIIFLLDRKGVFATTAGEAGLFETPPAVGSYAIDNDSNFGFGIDFVDNVVDNGDGTVSIDPHQVQVLGAETPGMVKIDSWMTAAVPNGTSVVGATFTNGTYDGFNVLADGSLDQAGNGCTIVLQNLQFTNMHIKWQTGAFPTSFAPTLKHERYFGPRTVTAPIFHMDRN